MNTLEDFLLRVKSAPPAQLQLLLRVHPQHNPWVVLLHNAGPFAQVGAAVDRRHFFQGDWPAFDMALELFVVLCAELNPRSLLESFDLYTTYVGHLAVAFTHKSHGHLVTPLLVDTIEFVMPLARQLDQQLLVRENHRQPRLSYMAATLLKVFNNIRSQLGADDAAEAAKKAVMLSVSNKLCQTYFWLDNPLLCRNVFSNMNNANLRFAVYPPNQQLQYRYHLARFYLAKYQFADAYTHLWWCLTKVPRNHTIDQRNVRLILAELLPVAIILGKTPNFNAFALFFTNPLAYLPVYAELLAATKSGSFRRLHSLVNSALPLLKHYKVAVFVASKAFVVTLRNLFRKVWVLQGKQARLGYDALKAALAVSLDGLPLSAVTQLGPTPPAQPIDDLVVENCLVTLIDQNLLKGKVFSRVRMVLLAKTEVFPAVDSINFIKFGHGAEGVLSGADRWIGKT